jgi:hypothetical protein
MDAELHKMNKMLQEVIQRLEDFRAPPSGSGSDEEMESDSETAAAAPVPFTAAPAPTVSSSMPVHNSVPGPVDPPMPALIFPTVADHSESFPGEVSTSTPARIAVPAADAAVPEPTASLPVQSPLARPVDLAVSVAVDTALSSLPATHGPVDATLFIPEVTAVPMPVEESSVVASGPVSPVLPTPPALPASTAVPASPVTPAPPVDIDDSAAQVPTAVPDDPDMPVEVSDAVAAPAIAEEGRVDGM